MKHTSSAESHSAAGVCSLSPPQKGPGWRSHLRPKNPPRPCAYNYSTTTKSVVEYFFFTHNMVWSALWHSLSPSLRAPRPPPRASAIKKVPGSAHIPLMLLPPLLLFFLQFFARSLRVRALAWGWMMRRTTWEMKVQNCIIWCVGRPEGSLARALYPRLCQETPRRPCWRRPAPLGPPVRSSSCPA